jgi:Tfp pilus assembly protein PilF
MPMRMMAYMAGFGGNKEKGLRLIANAAEYPGENQTDARLAMLLLDNREGQYDAALEQLRILREKYPKNRIFWLETGATYLRAGRAAEAEKMLTDGLAHFADDARPKMFGEAALWYYKRGMARAALGHAADAQADLGKALASEGRQWVYGRSHLERGKLAIKAGDRSAANNELRQAVALCTADKDVATAAEAQRLIK